MNPLFSVVIPAYNEEKYISKCIESINKQIGDFKMEIIVVDNNSTDKTVQIATNLGAKVLLELKQGVGSARRRGTEEASGDIVVHLDADSIISNNYLQRVKKYFSQDKRLVCLGGQYVFYDAPWWKDLLRYPIFYLLLYSARIFSWGRIGVMGACMSFRKDTYNKTNGFNANLKFGEDADLCRQLSYFGKAKVKPNLKCFVSSRRFKTNFHLLILFWQYLKMVFGKDPNYEFPHSDKL